MVKMYGMQALQLCLVAGFGFLWANCNGQTQGLPGQLSSLEATGYPRSIHVSWTPSQADQDSGNPLLGYKLFYRTAMSSEIHQLVLSQSVTSWTISNLSPSVTYMISVRAFNFVGYGLATNIEVTTGGLTGQQVPEQVSSLTARGLSTAVHVSWTPDPADQNTEDPSFGYVLGYGTTVPDEYQIQLPADVTCWVIANLSPATEYVISVRAVNNVGMGRSKYVTVFTEDADADDPV